MKELFCVISNYNDLEWIDRCLSSLRKSAYPVQTIVVDDASTDRSCEKIKADYSEVELIECSENGGYAVANNIGIKRALKQGADYIFLLNMDAWIEQNTLKILVEKMERYLSFFILSPMHLNAKGDGLDLRFSHYLDPKKCPNIQSDIYLNTLQEIYEIEHVMSTAWLLRSETIRRIGYFDDQFSVYGPDDNYVDRVHYNGGKIGLVPSSRIYHTKDESNDEDLPVREVYHLQKMRNLVTAMNPNLSFLQKSLYVIKKSLRDISVYLLNRNYKNSWKSFQTLFHGSFMIMKYNRMYKK